MDFRSLLDTAAKNAIKQSQKIEHLSSEAEQERKNELRRIEAEKKEKQLLMQKMREQRPKREPTPEKKFVIPKKKSDPAVDSSKIKDFLAKQEAEKRASDKQKLAEKDKLIQLRLQANGGKANKKIGKHFGINPIDMQIRYGNDHTHVERLQKQQWREQEELDNLSTQYRGGVYKAKQEMSLKLQTTGANVTKKEPHRVATSKANSLAGLSSRHAATRDHFSPPREVKKDVPKPEITEKKKRPVAPPVSFDALMKVAADSSAGKKVDLTALGPPPSKVAKLNSERSMPSKSARSSSSQRSETSSSSNTSDRLKKSSSNVSLSASGHSSNSTNHVSSSSSKGTLPRLPSSSTARKPELTSNYKSDSSSRSDVKQPEKAKEKKDSKGRFVKGPTPPPAIPSAVLGKRYLPGDVRYKEQQEMMKTAGILPTSSKTSSTSTPSIKQKKTSMGSLFGSSASHKDTASISKSHRSTEQRSLSSGYGSSSSSSRNEASSSSKYSRDHNGMSREEKERRRRALEKKQYQKQRYEQMSLVERERERERQKLRERYGYGSDDSDGEDDDEYDSELDDFIDDSGMDIEDFSRQDFEETLKMVNPKYDQKKWRQREKMISDREMESDFRQMQKEEARSTRLGILEDVYEAKKHNSIAL